MDRYIGPPEGVVSILGFSIPERASAIMIQQVNPLDELRILLRNNEGIYGCQ